MQCRNTNGALNAVTTSMVYHKLCPPGIYLSQFAVKTLCSIFSEIQERIWSLLKVPVIIVRIASFAFAGADPGFILGGGGGLCARTHIKSAKTEVPVYGRPARVQGTLEGPGSSRGFDALSCYLSLVSILIQNGIQKHSPSKLRGSAPPPLDPPLFRAMPPDSSLSEYDSCGIAENATNAHRGMDLKFIGKIRAKHS